MMKAGSWRRTVLVAVGMFFVLWMTVHFVRLTGDEDGKIRFGLGALFSLAVLLRWKPLDPGGAAESPSPVLVLALGSGGAVLALAGLIFPVRQFEWMGLILVTYACLRWALPNYWAGDLARALFLLYWVHPLPGRLFGALQLAMQFVSIRTAEWILHCRNVRVWADGLILRAGFRAFGVPESCSGMKTGVTVALCALGVSILLRFRWYETLAIVLVGIAQVLLINALRIAFVVAWSARMPVEWGQTFLHDSLGTFLLLSVLLVHIEAVAWKYWSSRRRNLRGAVDRGDVEEPDRATRLPKFWRLTFRWGRWAVCILALVTAVSFGAYKARPSHRVAMIGGMVDALIETDLESAHRAVNYVLQRDPRNREMATRRINVLVRRGKFSLALEELAKLGEGLTTFETILKSWALMSLNRLEEAIVLIDALPESARSLPGVAIVRAEYGAMQDKPEDVSRHIARAAHTHVPINRIRALFPFLASHEQWEVIAACDSPEIPYATAAQAVVAVHASLRSRNFLAAARSLDSALIQWPHDARFLNSLFTLASHRPGGKWEEFFARSLTANLADLSEDRLATYLNYCFRLKRPDLAWQVFVRLRARAPEDPALSLAPAWFGNEWLTFRRHQLSVGGPSRAATIDIGPLYAQTRGISLFTRFWQRVPLVDEVTSSTFDQIRKRRLGAAIAEFARREQAGRLTLRMEMGYATALALDQRFDEAHRRLDQTRERHPEMAEEVLFQHAVFYDQQSRWQDSYESLMTYRREVGMPNLTGDLILINALVNLDMGVQALEVARLARKAFPGSSEMEMAYASIWDVFGHKDQALFVLSNAQGEDPPPAIVQLLHDTGRYREAERMSRALGVTVQGKADGKAQSFLPVAAERSIARRWPDPIPEERLQAEAAEIEKATAAATSPFIRALGNKASAWYRANGGGATSDPAVWADAGRDPAEKASALFRLTMILAQQQRYDAATQTACLATDFLPDSPILWRARVSLSEGNEAVVREAARRCPDDPELWLAWLVTRARRGDQGDWARGEASTAVEAKRFSADTMVRAGDFFLRQGMTNAAAVMARDAVARGPGFIPAYALALRSALAMKDRAWALSSAIEGVQHAVNPVPFYRSIVLLKALEKSKDADMVSALEYLKQHFPRDPKWAERLGFVYFQRGDHSRALSILAPVVSSGLKKVRVQSLLIAAEAARLEGRPLETASVLEAGHALYPNRVSILNNLVYSLAQDPATVKRARELLPGLLELGGQSYAVLDTAAVVYLRSGQYDEAKRFMGQALAKVKKEDYLESEVSMNAAELALRSGDLPEARRRLDALRRNPNLPRALDIGVRSLMDELVERERKRPR